MLTSGSTIQFRSRVLVLGTRGLAARLAGRLEAEGLQAVLPGLSDDQLPHPGDPLAAERLLELLSGFARSGPAAPAGSLHYVHPGLSVWADRPELVTLGQRCGLTVICPPPRVLTLFGNKLSLLTEAESLGIPNLIAAPEPMHSLREIEHFIREHDQRFPFILKSAKGGNRYGLLTIHEPRDLESKLPLWMEQLRRNYGEVILFAERYLEGARHIMIPFARFLDGRSETFPAVDCSLQSRQRKIIEFCPAESIDSGIEAELRGWTRALAERCGYVGVGSLEFLVDSGRAYLIGGTARLNTGFHLWEKIAGTSAVAWQLAAMQGGSATPAPPCDPDPRWRSGLSLRLYAEDSLLQLPQPGHVREVGEKNHWDLPNAEAELDLSFRAGEDIGIHHHGFIGALWVGARTRALALVAARGILDEIWIAGSLQTNERFLSELLRHPWIQEGIFHTGFIDEEFLPALRPPAELIRLFASVLLELQDGEPLPGSRWTVGDQWVKADPKLVSWIRGPDRFEVARGEAGWRGLNGTIRIPDGRSLRLCAFPLGPDRWQVRLHNWVMVTRRVGPKSQVKPGAPPRIASLIHGRIHSILFREGATVPAHQPILTVESLGMLVPHALPVDVQIRRWKVATEELVQAGQDLAEFEILSKT